MERSIRYFMNMHAYKTCIMDKKKPKNSVCSVFNISYMSVTENS